MESMTQQNIEGVKNAERAEAQLELPEFEELADFEELERVRQELVERTVAPLADAQLRFLGIAGGLMVETFTGNPLKGAEQATGEVQEFAQETIGEGGSFSSLVAEQSERLHNPVSRAVFEKWDELSRLVLERASQRDQDRIERLKQAVEGNRGDAMEQYEREKLEDEETYKLEQDLLAGWHRVMKLKLDSFDKERVLTVSADAVRLLEERLEKVRQQRETAE